MANVGVGDRCRQFAFYVPLSLVVRRNDEVDFAVAGPGNSGLDDQVDAAVVHLRERGVPPLVTPRNSGPAVIPASSRHPRIAATGQRPGTVEAGSPTSSSFWPVWITRAWAVQGEAW